LKAHRGKQRAEESAESKVFREFMARDAVDESFVAAVEEHADRRPDTPDFEALQACCRYVGMVSVGRARVHVVEPLRPYEDNMDFDREVCKAGLKRFVRRPMESDYPGHGTPLNPEVPPPDVDWGEWLIVLEMSEGFRTKSGIRIGWLRELATY
jgi:hypothetical protein